MTLFTFNTDTGPKLRESATPLKNIKALSAKTYAPAACTPLYDVVGHAIRHAEKKLNNNAVLFVVMTDGEENSSKEFTRDAIFSLIDRKTNEDGWTFAYLGANQDAWEVGQSIGVASPGNAMAWEADPAGAKRVWARLGKAAMGWHDAEGAQTENFFEDDSADK